MQPRRPSETSSVLTQWMGIEDANTAGYVHGGVIMRLCDEVAGIAAIRHCGMRVVTAGMDRMTFLATRSRPDAVSAQSPRPNQG